VTASLPMPQDAHSDDPDGDRGGARGSESAVLSLPPKPETPAELAAQQKPSANPAVKAPVKRAPGKTPRKEVAADPGAPPPLPADLVIPPKPPLPPIEQTQPPAPEPEPEPEPEVAELPAEVSEPPTDFAEPEVKRDFEPAAVVVPETPAAASIDTAAVALGVKGVTKSFGETRAVDGIDLTVPAGIFYGLVGPNGAGKTTTLSMIAGLLRPDRGSISVNGVDAASDPLGAKRQMGVLPDRLRTFDRLTGRQLLHYYGLLRGLPPAVVESRATDLARAFDLSDSLGRVVSDYSAGMVKKVMLAGALIHSPRLLVLDEPFESVDPVSSAIILDILKTYVAHGGTVILSSHGMDLVERVCSRVAVIVAGQVLAEGTIDEVRGELTLEQRFIELAGGLSDVEGLEWLHTFSD